MGHWYLDENDHWQYDPDAPGAGVTALAPRGEGYDRVDPAQFDLFDDVDSTTIIDDGGPPDAA